MAVVPRMLGRRVHQPGRGVGTPLSGVERRAGFFGAFLEKTRSRLSPKPGSSSAFAPCRRRAAWNHVSWRLPTRHRP